MELNELITKIEECKQELREIGAISIDMFDDFSERHGAKIAVHVRNRDLPKGKVNYDTSTYTDAVVKNVVVGNVAFFAIISIAEAVEECAITGDMGLYTDVYGALV